MVHSVLGYMGCDLLELNVEWHLHGQGSACCHISLNPDLTWGALSGSANWNPPQNNETLQIKLRTIPQSISHVSWGYTLQMAHLYSIHKEFPDSSEIHHGTWSIWLWSYSSHFSSATHSKGFHVITESYSKTLKCYSQSLLRLASGAPPSTPICGYTFSRVH